MSEQTASITLHAGDTLTRSDGATAEVRAVEMSNRDKKNVVFGYKIFIAEPGEEARIALITVADLPGFLRTWHLQQPDGQPVLESAPVAAHPDAPSASPSLLAERGLGGEVDSALIADLRAEIAALTERNTFLESRLDGLVESRDSAIAHNAAAADRANDLDLVDDDGQAIDIRTLKEMYDNLYAEYMAENVQQEKKVSTLTEQLAAARAEIAASASPLPLAERGLGGEVLSAPVREFKIMTAISVSDLCKMEREGWQIQHMQFNDTALNVVYFRYSPRPEGEGQGVRVSVKPVGPQVTILPDTSRLPDSFRNHMKDVFAEGQRVYNERMAQSPIPAHRPLTSLPAGGSK